MRSRPAVRTTGDLEDVALVHGNQNLTSVRSLKTPQTYFSSGYAAQHCAMNRTVAFRLGLVALNVTSFNTTPVTVPSRK